MTSELRELLAADNRCFYCREKCDSTDPPHSHRNCPALAKKLRKRELMDKLAHLNQTRNGKRQKTN
jgi:hypothetical protein